MICLILLGNFITVKHFIEFRKNTSLVSFDIYKPEIIFCMCEEKASCYKV